MYLCSHKNNFVIKKKLYTESKIYKCIMKQIYLLYSIVILLLCVNVVHSQEISTEFSIDFRVGKSIIERGYSDNVKQLSAIDSFLQNIEKDSTIAIYGVSFSGLSSPEGSYEINRRLSKERLKAFENVFESKIDLLDSMISYEDTYIPWEYLKERVIESDMLHKQAVLDIIDLEPQLVVYLGCRHIDHRVLKLESLEGGKVWKELYGNYFKSMRTARVVFDTYKRKNLTPSVEEIESPLRRNIVKKPEACDSIDFVTPLHLSPEWSRCFYIKTNAVGLGLGISNIAVEFDIAKHWSLSVPAYYAAHNYFVSTIKFRTLAVQPEVRYWIKDDNQGFFAGAHFGYAQYNVAVDGDIRYQDHDGKSPFLGGGISVGYSLPISTKNNWHIEFAIGAGIYNLYYDRFYNVNNGKLIDTVHKTYFGIDNVAINIAYSIDLNKHRK